MSADSAAQVPSRLQLSASAVASSRSESTTNWYVDLSKIRVYAPVSCHSTHVLLELVLEIHSLVYNLKTVHNTFLNVNMFSKLAVNTYYITTETCSFLLQTCLHFCRY